MNKKININIFIAVSILSMAAAVAVYWLYSIGALTIKGYLVYPIVVALLVFGVANLVLFKKRDNPKVRTFYKIMFSLIGLLGLYFLVLMMLAFASI